MKYYLTELIGTFFLTLTVGLASGSPLAPLAIGAVLMVLVYAGGYISGGHFNPAVSIAVALSRAFSKGKVRAYALAQIVGATAGALFVAGLTGKAMIPAPSGTILFAPMCAEILFTFLLCYVVLHTAVAKEAKGSQSYGLAIGSVLLIAATVAGPISGAVLNPAIGLGTFLVSLLLHGGMPLSALVLYLVGPVIGAILASALFGMQRS